MLSDDQQRHAADGIAGDYLAERTAPVTRQELERALGYEGELFRALARLECVGALPHAALLDHFREDLHADVGEVAQELRAAQRHRLIHAGGHLRHQRCSRPSRT